MITMSLNDWQLIWLAFHVGFIVSRQRYWEAIKTKLGNKRKRKIRFTLYEKETRKRFGQAEKALRKNITSRMDQEEPDKARFCNRCPNFRDLAPEWIWAREPTCPPWSRSSKIKHSATLPFSNRFRALWSSLPGSTKLRENKRNLPDVPTSCVILRGNAK